MVGSEDVPYKYVVQRVIFPIWVAVCDARSVVARTESSRAPEADLIGYTARAGELIHRRDREPRRC